MRFSSLFFLVLTSVFILLIVVEHAKVRVMHKNLKASTHQLNSNFDQLQNFIRRQRGLGVSDEAIRQELLGVGWLPKEIEPAFTD